MRSADTRIVALLGDPVSSSLSPLMQNTAFGAAGLDWIYVALPVRSGDLEAAIRGLVALGFAGANVTTPHKLAVSQLVDTDLQSVNTLVLRDGNVYGYSTDAAVLESLPTGRLAILGDGGAATAFAEAHADAVRFSRSGAWPPEVAGFDVVVNATSERDEVLVELQAEQTLVDLPYPPTATAKAAERSGATVVDGLQVLAAQGAAAFTLWTSIPAPLDLMLATVRSA